MAPVEAEVVETAGGREEERPAATRRIAHRQAVSRACRWAGGLGDGQRDQLVGEPTGRDVQALGPPPIPVGGGLERGAHDGGGVDLAVGVVAADPAVVTRGRGGGARDTPGGTRRADAGQVPDAQVARECPPPPRRLARHRDGHDEGPPPVVGGGDRRRHGRDGVRRTRCRRGRPHGDGGHGPDGTVAAVTPPDHAVRVEQVAPVVTHDLRGRVLRPGAPPDRVHWAADDLPGTAAFAATDADGAVVGTALVYPEPCPWKPDRAGAWRLRGMATDEARRSAGIGAAVLAAVVTHVTRRARVAGVVQRPGARTALLREGGLRGARRRVGRPRDRAPRRHVAPHRSDLVAIARASRGDRGRWPTACGRPAVRRHCLGAAAGK